MIVVFKKNPLPEALWLFGYIMALIWTSTIFSAWITAPLAIAGVFYIWVSWRRDEDTRGEIGICPKEEGFGYWWLGLLWVLVALGFVFAIGAWITPGFWKDRALLNRLGGVAIGYLLSCFFQELLAHGYFTNRLGKAFEGRPVVPSLILGAMFGLIHLPNPVLTLITPVFGFSCAYFFLTKSRNLYLFTIAHVVLSTAVRWLIAYPLIGGHSMRVGPGYWH